MKKILFSLLAGLLLTSGLLNAQKTNVVKTSLTSIFLKTYVLDYEKAFNEDMSGQLGFYYTGYSFLDVKFSGFAITPEFRYYLSDEKTAPNGAFIAPYFRYQNFTLEDASTSETATFTGIGGGILIGAQRVFKDVITLSAFIGPSYISPSVTYDNPNTTWEFERGSGGVWARAGINVGIVF
ncbi:MAG: DUF3575 domain-containing protein [Bacteroidales bacterium]|nr:DUF3575 domain-containing protein [Bacteroidales bacterium]MCF8391177.1 DUF3575 domain-containing protein [Bacteroidales bacterium]